MCLQKGNDMEILSSKEEEEFQAKTFVVNILKLHTNPKVLIQEFVWSIEIDHIISMSIPFKRHLFFVKIRCIIAELLSLKVEQYPIHLL